MQVLTSRWSNNQETYYQLIIQYNLCKTLPELTKLLWGGVVVVGGGGVGRRYVGGLKL
jgi:hypothetical protein